MPPPALAKQAARRYLALRLQDKASVMGINDERDIEANLQIGPTDQGMVRLFIAADGIEIPMDFEPEEAEEIADEIRAAAQGARKLGPKPKSRPKRR